MPVLPAHPSAEHLRKAAKRRARETGGRLADAQRSIARSYGFANWAALMRHVGISRASASASRAPLLAAVRSGDLTAVRQRLAGGANPRLGDGREAPLHAAARRGPLELVELLIAGGAFEWQTDRQGRTPLDIARRNRPRDRAAIIAVLDRSAIADPSFRAAVAAIHGGDAAELARLIDREPRLLHERLRGPEIYRTLQRHQYFLDPALFWFVAYNPSIVKRMPANITAVAQTMIDRGVEQTDLDYTLGLVMSSSVAREEGRQNALIGTLLAAGAVATDQAIAASAAHREVDALRALLAAGHTLTAPIAATLGEQSRLADLLASASRSEIQTAFAFAVINAQVEAVRAALDAGADVNAFLPVHAHSTALHQAAIDDNVPLIRLLLERGARPDIRDTLWDGTPYDWAVHQQRPAAAAALRERNDLLSREDHGWSE
jgi:peptide-methionine (S)-S-oxide reductase